MTYRCFVIIPYEPGSDAVYRAIMASAPLMPKGVEIDFVRADSKQLRPEFEANVVQHMALCDFAVADLSDGNQNVAYEVGYASAIGKPVILMSSSETRLPSNLTGRHFLSYDPDRLETLTAGLVSFVPAAIAAAKEVPRSGSFITTGYMTLDSAELVLAIRSARRRLDVLAPSLEPLVSSGFLSEIQRVLESSGELVVRVLALDPESAFVNFRARQLGYATSVYRDELRKALASVRRVVGRERCELRLFDEPPYYHLYRVDQNVFLSLLTSPVSRAGLTFRFRTNDPGTETILHSFMSLWSSAG